MWPLLNIVCVNDYDDDNVCNVSKFLLTRNARFKYTHTIIDNFHNTHFKTGVFSIHESYY